MAKRKDAPSSVLTRSGRETSTAIQDSRNPLNTRKSPRFEKQMGPTPSTIKKKPETSEKQIGSTPLRRSERGKNPVDVPASKVKSTEKSADISEESAEDGSRDSNGGIKKRKRYNAVEFRARYKPQRVRVETERSEVLAHIESPSSSGDQFWSAAVGNGTPVANETVDGNADSLYQHLKPTVSELCDILKFSEGAKIIVERFLKFVVGNFNVSKEHTNILQALMISVCWICSSLLEHTIDRKKSFALAKKHFNFSCKEEEADQVYEKLNKPKEMFLQSPMNLKVLNAFKDRASRPEEPRMSPAVPINPQEQKRENHGSSNEEALQSSGRILEEDIARKERNEIGKFDREWREKKMNIVNEFELEKTLIRYLHGSNSSVRSEKLNLVEKEFADKMNEHERSRQVLVNDEISLHGPAHETQIVDLVESEKEDQESREVAPALLGNPIEAESHDKPVHDLSPVVVPDGVVNLSDSSNDMVSGSHTSEKHMSNATVLSKPIGEAPAKQDADMVNDVARADTTVLSELIGDIPAKHVADMGNDVAGADANVLSEPIGDIPAIEDIASEQQDEVANVVSSETIGDISAEQDADMENDVAGADVPDIKESALEQDDEIENVVSGDDAMVLTEPIGDIPAKQHADMEIDVAGQDESLELEVPEVYFNKENAKGVGTSSPDGSHAVEARSETGQNDLVPHVDVVETEIPAVNNLRTHVDSADGSHAIEDAIGTGSNDVASHSKSPELGMPVGNDMASNVDSTDESRSSVDPNATGPNDIASHVDSGEMEILAGNDTAPHVGSAADGSNAVEDGNETTPSDMTQLDDPCEMNMPAVNDVTPNVDSDDGSHAIQDPSKETGLCGMSPHVDSDETGMPADNDMAPNDYSADMSHAAEDPNKNGSNDISLHADSDQMGIPAANDFTPHIEYACLSHAVEDPNGTGPNHVAPNVESPELGIPAGNCNQEKAQDTTPSVQQVASPVSNHSMAAIPEIHTDSHLLQQPSENGIQDQEGQADPTPMVEIEDDIMQPVEAIQVDQIIPEVSSLSPHDEPLSAISTDPTITENQAAMPSTSEVLVQTTAPPITAQAQIQLEQYMVDLLRNANSNQAGSRMTRRVDPFRIELEQLSSVKEKMVKSYHDNIQKMNIDCEKEIAEAIAEIRLKYCNKRQEADATFSTQKKAVENSMNTVVINQVLASTFRRKCQDVSHGCAAVQQACQAESMQQQRRFRGSSTCLPGQSSGTQQTPPPPPPPIPATAVATPPQQTQPPLQIVHQPSALFSTPLTNLRPTNATPIRPPTNTIPIPTAPLTTTTSRSPPINNPITPPITVSSRPPTIANLIIPSTTTNRPPPMINPITPSTPTTTNRPLATITPITPSSTTSPIRSPHGINPLTSSTTPIRTPSRLNPFGVSSPPLVSSVTRSTPRHMRPFVSREIRTAGPHMRPLASSDIRSSTSHMRPSNPTSSSGPLCSRTHHRTLPVQHRTLPVQHRTLPVQHVTSSPPLTSPSNSQTLNSTLSVQPLPPLPRERFPVSPPPQPRSESPQPPPSQLPHASAAKSAHSSLPCGPSMPLSGGPQDKLNDNVNALTDNARGLNILKTPESPGGGNGAQPPSPSAHEVVYLSDDD